jgi:hypothetical protein
MTDVQENLAPTQERVWGIPQEGQPKDILGMGEWKDQGYKVAATLKRNKGENKSFYLTVITPNGQRGAAYFSKAIQALLEENKLEEGDKVNNLAKVIAIHVAKDDQNKVTDLFIGAMSKENDWL